jgi:hypothetical protein
MKYAGGELVSMWVSDPELLAPLQEIGRARIVEIAVPLAATPGSYSCQSCRGHLWPTLGAIPDKGAFDLYANQALPPQSLPFTPRVTPPSPLWAAHPPGLSTSMQSLDELTGEED